MSFRQSSGRDLCNRCRQTPDLGAPVYVSDRTPGACWCEGCALEVLGQAPDGPVPLVRVAGDMDTFNVPLMAAQLRAAILQRRARGKESQQ